MRRAQVSPQTALMFIEQLWNTELRDFDVDGPLPDFDPVVSDTLDLPGPGQRPPVRQGPGRAAAELAGPAEPRTVRPGGNHRGDRPAVVRRLGARRSRRRSTNSCRPTPPTATSWSRTSPPAGWPRSSTRSSPAAGARRVPRRLRPAPRCATISAGPLAPPGTGRRAVGRREDEPHDRMTPLTVLDLVPISSGSTRRPRRCATASTSPSGPSALGYARYWFAEHHLNPGVAGTSPAVVLALTAAATSTIRLGSGRRADGAPHRAVHGRGVRPARRAAPGPDRPRPGPLGRPRRRASRRPRGRRAATGRRRPRRRTAC